MLENSQCRNTREGNGTPLQYSCLENPMDGGAWWAAVRGVAKSRTRLSDFTFTFHFHALEMEMATHSSVLAWRIPRTVVFVYLKVLSFSGSCPVYPLIAMLHGFSPPSPSLLSSEHGGALYLYAGILSWVQFFGHSLITVSSMGLITPSSETVQWERWGLDGIFIYLAATAPYPCIHWAISSRMLGTVTVLLVIVSPSLSKRSDKS